MNKMVECKTVHIDNFDIDYMVFGKGRKKLAILPGLDVHSTMRLKDNVSSAYEIFTQDYTVYLIERRNIIPENFTIDNASLDTAYLLSSISSDKWDIMGFSYGGMISLSMMVNYPSLIRKVVLGSTISKRGGQFSSLLNEWRNKAEKKDEEGLIWSFISNVYSSETVSKYGKKIAEGVAGISEKEYERFLRLLASLSSFDVEEKLKNINISSFVIGALGDRVTPWKEQEKISNILNAKYYMYSSTYGHAVYDEAGDYKERCLDFFNKD